MADDTHIHHPEEIENAKREGRPVSMARLFTAHHLKHEIPLGTLVEVEVEEYGTTSAGGEINLKGACKLFVVAHVRDCDGTPCYSLCDMPVVPPAENFFTVPSTLYHACAKVFIGCHSDDGLKLTGKTVTLHDDMRSYYGM